MLADILEAIRVKEEEFVFAGKKMRCRELAISETLGVEVKSDEDQARLEEDFVYRLAVRSVFFVDGENAGQPVFTDEDIPALKAGSKTTLLALFAVVRRVNGLDGDANAKK